MWSQRIIRGLYLCLLANHAWPSKFPLPAAQTRSGQAGAGYNTMLRYYQRLTLGGDLQRRCEVSPPHQPWCPDGSQCNVCSYAFVRYLKAFLPNGGTVPAEVMLAETGETDSEDEGF